MTTRDPELKAPLPNGQEKYERPEIVLELELETRAGSTLPTGINPLDLTGVGGDTDFLP